MEIEPQNEKEDKIKNIIINYFKWEKEKELLLTKKNNIISNEQKEFYLVEKEFLNKFKKIVNIDKIKQKLKANSNKDNQDTLVNEYIQNELSNINPTDLSLLNNVQKYNESQILKELLENKNFVYEIVNEELKNALNDFNKGNELIKTNGKIINDKILFDINSSFGNKNIIKLIFMSDESFYYETFFIINSDSYKDLLKIIEEKSFQEILGLYDIDYNSIDESGEIIKKDNCEIVIKKQKLNLVDDNNNSGRANINNEIKSNMNNENDIDGNNNNNNDNENHISSYQKDKIIEFFKYISYFNLKFKNALEKGDIHNNYSPCKIINQKWIKCVFNNFLNNDFTLKNNLTQKDFDYFGNQSSQNLNPVNVNKGEFYIIDETFFVSLFPFINDLETHRNKFKDYEIFLNNNKGVIIIEDNIYIFETRNYDINDRYHFLEVTGNKNEIMAKIKDINNYELTESEWKELKDNANISNNNGNNNGNNNINDTNFILNNNMNSFNNNLNSQNKDKIIDNHNNNNNIIINENDNNNNIINETYTIDEFLDFLFKKEMELNETKINLDKFEQMIEAQNKISFANSNNINNVKNANYINNINIVNNANNVNNANVVNLVTRIKLDIKSPTIGLQNLGATCYMNAPLQCMAHFVEVSEEMINWYKYSYDKNKTDKVLSNAYAYVLDNLYFPKEYNNYSKYFSPEVLKEIVGSYNPLFQGIKANDSKDIYNYLIEKMHNELNDLYKPVIDNYNQNERYDQTNEQITLRNFKRMFAQNYHSILSKYLYGIQKTITQCCRCQKNIYNFQTYNFLIFPLLDVKNYIINLYQQQNLFNQFMNYQNYTLSLNDCFFYYQKIDFFCGDNSIHCNMCRSIQNSKYRNLLYSVPTILCIVLNRGKNNADFKERIIFGIDLDLSNFVEENNNNAKYYLIGVVCHVGDSSMSGHFFAYCRSHYTSKWYLYNDAIVSESNENKILSEPTPYILFYHKYT